MDKELLIELYFSQQLDDSRLKELQDLLENDEDFRKDFEFQKDLKSAILISEKERLKKILINEEQQIGSASNNVKTLVWPQFLKIAAILVLFMAVSWFVYINLSSPTIANLYADNYSPYPNTYYEISRGDDEMTPERSAFVAYETGDYQRAIKEFSVIQKPLEPNYIDFYLAQSYMAQGNYEKAIPYFVKLKQSTSELKEESLWYLSLCYLKLNKKDDAENNLKTLIENASYKLEEAKVLLNELTD